jgi:hypothetical protein
VDPDEPLGHEVMRLHDTWAAPVAYPARFARRDEPVALAA